MVIRFDLRNPRAEADLRGRSGRLVTEVIEDTKVGIREVLTANMADGINPRTAALDVVGRVNKITKRREGGLVGLTSGQMQYVANARAELSSPDTANGYFARQRRDKRFDGVVARSIKDGKPLSNADIDRITARYSDRLLKLRGDTIARTEMLGSIHAAQVEAMRQLVGTGKVHASQVRKVWSATGDARTRDSHRALHGESIGLEDYFISPETGARMLHPGDMHSGAHGADVINCRCGMNIRVDYLSNL